MTDDQLIGTVLAALADPMRRRILAGVAAGHPTATALAEQLPISRQAVVKHLSVLHQAGLVAGRKTGREVRYRVVPQPLETAARWMTGLAAEWDQPLQAIKRLAEQGGEQPPS